MSYLNSKDMELVWAIWSRSSYLSMLNHAQIWYEIVLDRLCQEVESSESLSRVRELLAWGYLNPRWRDISGFEDFVRQFNDPIIRTEPDKTS